MQIGRHILVACIIVALVCSGCISSSGTEPTTTAPSTSANPGQTGPIDDGSDNGPGETSTTNVAPSTQAPTTAAPTTAAPTTVAPATTVPPTTPAPSISPMQYGWPLARHDPSSGAATDGDIPLSPSIEWSIPIYASTAPVVEYGNIYLGVRRVGERSLHGICCVDLATGDVEWTYEFADIYQNAMMFNSAPAIHQGNAYFVNTADGATYLTCCDAMTGDIIWNNMISDDKVRYASPVIVDGDLFLTSGELWNQSDNVRPKSTLERYDLDTGTQTWSCTYDGYSSGAAAYDSGMFFAATYNYDAEQTGLYGIDADTGTLVWSKNVKQNGSYDVSTPMAWNGAAYVALSYTDGDYDYVGKALCMNIQTGTILWESMTEDAFFDIRHPCIAGGYMIVPTNMNLKVTYTAFDLETGGISWRTTHDIMWDASSSAGKYFVSVDSSNPYITSGNYEAYMMIYDTQDTSIVMERTYAMQESDYWTDAFTPALAGGKIIVAIGNSLICYG